MGGTNPKTGDDYESLALAFLLLRLAAFGTGDAVIRVEDGAEGAECRFSTDGAHWERHQCKSDSTRGSWTGARFLRELLRGAEDALAAGESYVVHSMHHGVIPQLSKLARAWDPQTWVSDLTDEQVTELQSVVDGGSTGTTSIEDLYPLLRNIEWHLASDDSLSAYVETMIGAMGTPGRADHVRSGLKDLAGQVGHHPRQEVIDILGIDPQVYRAAVLAEFGFQPLDSIGVSVFSANAWKVVSDALDGNRWPSQEERGMALATALSASLASGGRDVSITHPKQEPDICGIATDSAGLLYFWLEFPVKGPNQRKAVLVRAEAKPEWRELRWPFDSPEAMAVTVEEALLGVGLGGC